MPELEVVTIIGGVLSLKSLQFLTQLQVLQLIDCDVSDASFLGKLNRLQILYLKGSPIEIPEKLGDYLTRLKLLYVETSISPITIKKFPQLEEFYGLIKNWKVGGMSSQESNVPEIAELNSQPDGSVVCLPEGFRFQKLQRYVIGMDNGDGDEIMDFFEIDDDDDEIGVDDKFMQKRSLGIKNYPPEATSLVIFSALYQNMELLSLDGVIGGQNIVTCIDKWGLNELTYLLLKKCINLECITDASRSPHERMLSKLAWLYLQGLPELKWIWKAPANHLSLKTLTRLGVSKCNNLTYIFTLSQAPSLMQLKILEVSGCGRLECIVEAKVDHDEGEITVGDGNAKLAFPLLRKLRLEKLPKLISFCSKNYYSIWPALEELYLGDCPDLAVNHTELEANLQYLQEKLQILRVSNCSHLHDTIPALLRHGLKILKELHIIGLGAQVVFQLEDGQENKLFPCLKVLELKNLRELQALLCHEGPTHIFSLPNLSYLTVDGCTKLRHLLSSTLARNLLQLEELFICDCLELEQIIDEDEDEDEDEDHLQPVCFPRLISIHIESCPKLKRLFHISIAPSLQRLTDLRIVANDELQEVFWHKDGEDVMDYNEIVMKQLSALRLTDLPNLTNFWPAGYQIPSPSAYVRNCRKFRPN